MINFINFGHLVSLPFVYGKQNKTFASYFLTIFGEIPTIIISMMMIDHPELGRKKSLLAFFTATGFMYLLFAIYPLTLFSALARFFMKGCFLMLYPCTTEGYGTLNRALGFGFTTAIGKIGCTVIPYIVIPLVSVSTTMVFIMLMLFSWIGSVATYNLPTTSAGSLDESPI